MDDLRRTGWNARLGIFGFGSAMAHFLPLA